MLKFTFQYPMAVMLRCATALLTLVLAGSTAYATTMEFASFHLLNANQSLSFTNNGGTSGTLQALSVPVIFNFTVQSGLPTSDHAASLTINPAGTAATTTPAIVGGSLLDQAINPLRFSIIENGTGKNLLTMLSTIGDLVGLNGGVNASLSDARTNVFSSDFATFGSTFTESFNLGLATMSAPLAVGPGGFLNSFVSNVNGQFSVDSAGFTPIGVPEPASAVLLGMGLLTIAAMARRKPSRSGRRVTQSVGHRG